MAEAKAWVMIPKSEKMEIVIDMRPLVLCRDCKHLEHMYALDELNGKKCYVCRKHSFTGLREEDWFCADGESVTE